MRTILSLVAVAFAAATVAPPGADVPAPAKTPPNFLFILADDQAWNGTGVPMMACTTESGSKVFHTPNIDALAKRGMTFSNGYAAHPKCECSRAAILTGRSTTSLNAPTKMSRDWKAPASDALPNTLKRANDTYRAAHFGKWQWPMTPASMGYDASDGITQNETGNARDSNDPKLSFSLTRRACDFMARQVKEGHPFFLQMSYYAVHADPQALEATLKKYEGLGTSNAKGEKGDRAKMAAMTEDLDTCVGTLLAKLKALGIADNTYVIYMSDNGGSTKYLRGGKGNLGEGGVRVPLIVAGPGVKAGSACAAPAISWDIMPTVIDFAAPGAAMPKGVEGGSWKDILLHGGTGEVKRPIDRLVWHQPVENAHPQSSLRKGDYKLVYSWDTKVSELFDLAKDIREEHDLAKEMAERTAALTKELKDHVRAGLGDAAIAQLESGETPKGRPPGRDRPRKP